MPEESDVELRVFLGNLRRLQATEPTEPTKPARFLGTVIYRLEIPEGEEEYTAARMEQALAEGVTGRIREEVWRELENRGISVSRMEVWNEAPAVEIAPLASSSRRAWWSTSR